MPSKSKDKKKLPKRPQKRRLQKAPEKKTELVVMRPEEQLSALMKHVEKHTVGSLEDLAHATGVPIEDVKALNDALDLQLVQLSQFKETFAASLESNARNISIILDQMSSNALSKGVSKFTFDAFTYQKLTQALKTLRDVKANEKKALSAGGGNFSGDLSGRRFKVSRLLRVVEEVEIIQSADPRPVN